MLLLLGGLRSLQHLCSQPLGYDLFERGSLLHGGHLLRAELEQRRRQHDDAAHTRIRRLARILDAQRIEEWMSERVERFDARGRIVSQHSSEQVGSGLIDPSSKDFGPWRGCDGRESKGSGGSGGRIHGGDFSGGGSAQHLTTPSTQREKGRERGESVGIGETPLVATAAAAAVAADLDDLDQLIDAAVAGCTSRNTNEQECACE